MRHYKTYRLPFCKSTRLLLGREGRSITAARLIQDAPVEPKTLWGYDLYGASSTVEIAVTPIKRQTTLWPPSRISVGLSNYQRLWLSGLAAVCIVTGLYALLYHASSGSHWLLP